MFGGRIAAGERDPIIGISAPVRPFVDHCRLRVAPALDTDRDPLTASGGQAGKFTLITIFGGMPSARILPMRPGA